jgi:hypothetical protein
MRTTTHTTIRTLQLHRIMGCIYIYILLFTLCSLFSQFGSSLVERTPRFECFLQKSQRPSDFFGESLFLLHPLSLSSDFVHLLSLFLAISLALSLGSKITKKGKKKKKNHFFSFIHFSENRELFPCLICFSCLVFDDKLILGFYDNLSLIYYSFCFI